MVGTLIARFFDWACHAKRWPLLFLVGLFPLFTFTQLYFEDLSFRETFTHWCFLLVGAILVILAGVLYVAIGKPRRRRLWVGIPLSLCGFMLFVVGTSQLWVPSLPENKLVLTILRFSPISEGARDDAINFPHRIYELLLTKEQEEGAPLKVTFLGDKTIKRGNEESMKEAAIRLGRSQRGNAHVVLWGEIRKDGPELWVYPRLTLVRQPGETQWEEKKFGASVSPNLRDPTQLDFKKLLSTDIANIVVILYGLAYYKVSDWDNAIDILNHVDSYESYLIVGLAHFKKGLAISSKENLKKSVLSLTQAYNINQQDVVVLNNLAVANLYLGNIGHSKQYFKEAFKVDPKNPSVLSNLALTQYIEGDYESASASYKDALSYKDIPQIRSNLAFCLFELNRIEEAVVEWGKSVSALEKQSAKSWDGLDAQAGLAVGYYSLGKTEEAKKLYRQVVDQNSIYADLQRLEAEFLWAERIRAKAAELIEKCQ